MTRHRITPCGCAFALIAGLACAGAAFPDVIIHVDSARPDGGDGTSWDLAFNDLQVAFAFAGPGDEVWIAAGVYVPDGPAEREESFYLTSGVAVYGGFAGDEDDLAERDWVANETVLSGDRNGDDGPEFENYGDNCFHVVRAIGADEATVLDGVIITGGYAPYSSSPPVNHIGAGLYVEGGAPVVRHCTFLANFALRGGGTYWKESTVTLIDCAFRKNDAGAHGAGVRIWECSTATITGCSFHDNRGDVGAGIATDSLDALAISDTSFIGNRSVGGGGGAFIFETSETVVTGCTFIDNDTGGGSGAGLYLASGGTVRDCIFSANFAGFSGAGAVTVGDTTMINCVFSRGIAGLGGGVYAAGDTTMINCTISQNEGSGIVGENDETHVTLRNSILWGNIPQQVDSHSAFPPADFSAFSCDVQGGWSDAGSNNIDADPLFVQPGADNVRLSHGSPCLNAGDNSAVPPDVETDLDGNPRIQDGIVDMGAYEGEHDLLPASAVAADLDPGDFEFLVPNGVGFHPEDFDTVLVRSYTGADDATMSVTEMPGEGLTGAGGFSVIGTVLDIETTMSDGEFGNNLFMVFDEDDLGGADPLDFDVTYFDEPTGNWALAVSGNTANSPGHPRPIGDRHAVEGPGSWGYTIGLGDWGVYWDPTVGRGFVWANVDFAARFAFGVPLCPADVVQPPDGAVDWDDLRALLFAWGEGPGPYDIDNDGTVGVIDLVFLLNSWGVCP